MFPVLTTRRTDKRSLRELVRGAVETTPDKRSLSEAVRGSAGTAPATRSLGELVRGAVGTALEFATLGEATLAPVERTAPAPPPARAHSTGPTAPTAAHPHRRRLTRQPTPRRGGTVRPRAHVCRTPVHRPAHRRT
jgi:hypothetical protein